MRARVFAVASFVTVCWVSGAGGASFDCSKAGTPNERTICADPELSRLDAELAAAYRAALTATPTPVALGGAQRMWLRDRPSEGSRREELAASYRQRTDELNASAARDARVRDRAFSRSELSGKCFDLGVSDCRVERAGRVEGADLYFQIQRNRTDFQVGTIVFAAAPGDQLRPVVWSFHDDAMSEDVRLYQTPVGPLLVLDATLRGTGVSNAAIVFRRTASGWRDVDTESWRSELRHRIPHDLTAKKGALYDYSGLRAEVGLWRAQDGDCCASGGVADVALTLSGDQFSIRSLKGRPAE